MGDEHEYLVNVYIIIFARCSRYRSDLIDGSIYNRKAGELFSDDDLILRGDHESPEDPPRPIRDNRLSKSRQERARGKK